MKIASTAAVAAVEEPKIKRKARSHTIWYTSAHRPLPKRRAATASVLRIIEGCTDLEVALVVALREGHRYVDERWRGHHEDEN